MGAPGLAGSPDTAAQIAAKLATITLNANTLGGMPPSAFALAGTRTVSIPTGSTILANGATQTGGGWVGVDLPKNGNPSFQFSFVVPSDYVAGSPIVLDVVALNNQSAACVGDLRNNAVYAYPIGITSPAPAGLAAVSGTSFSLASNVPTTISFNVTLSSTRNWAPGDAMQLGLFREGTAAGDTCTGDYFIVGLAMRYTAH
jgi:hypothetical protein